MLDIIRRSSVSNPSTNSSEKAPESPKMPLDVWKFVLNVTRLRRRTPILHCESGEPRTQPSLADAKSEQLGTLSTTQKFICRDGVKTVRLLQLARNTLLEDAKTWGATALVDESWTCDIYRRKKDLYEVRVRYKASMAKVSKKDPSGPIAPKEAKGIPGVMTILDSSE